MSKKDYEIIAGAIRHSYAFDEDNEREKRTLAMDVASALAGTNPRFDRARFIAACMGEDSSDMAGRAVRYSQMRPGQVAR